MKTGIKSEVSFDELMSAWCQLIDLKMQLDRLRAKSGDGRAGSCLDDMIDKADRAADMLSMVIADIEGENPEAFGGEIISTVVLDYVSQQAGGAS